MQAERWRSLTESRRRRRVVTETRQYLSHSAGILKPRVAGAASVGIDIALSAAAISELPSFLAARLHGRPCRLQKVMLISAAESVKLDVVRDIRACCWSLALQRIGVRCL